jgi:hypothetical protein
LSRQGRRKQGCGKQKSEAGGEPGMVLNGHVF